VSSSNVGVRGAQLNCQVLMSAWSYVRGATVTASFLGGLFGTARSVDFGMPLSYIAAAVFAFGVVGMLFVIGIQAFNPRSDAIWSYPGWVLNPFTMRQPLQFFHFGGYSFLAAGIGALLRSVFVRGTPLVEPIVFAFWGAGILVGVWCCTRVFRRKMKRA
jgi:hypothetical protein